MCVLYWWWWWCTMTGGATDLVRLPGSEGPVDSAIFQGDVFFKWFWDHKHPAGCGIARVGASTCWKKWQPFQCFVAFWSGKKCSQKRSFFLDFATLTAQISDLFCLATFIDHCACRPHWLVIWWVIILTIWKIAIIPSISNNDQHMKLEGDFYHHWDELYRYRGERHYQQKYDNHYKLLWCTPQNRKREHTIYVDIPTPPDPIPTPWSA